MTSKLSNKTRQFWASAAMLFSVVGMVLFLTFVPIPEANDKTISLIIGTILGAATLAFPNLFGDPDEDRVVKLEASLEKMKLQYSILKEEHDRLVDMLVDRHVVRGDGLSHTD